MKKLVIAIALVAASTGAFARGWHGGPHHGGWHGRYVDQVQADGSTVRIWQPGHYEQQTVTVQ